MGSALRIKDMVRAAHESRMPALSLTDHMNMSGAVRFYDLCMESGILPILGIEAELAPFYEKAKGSDELDGQERKSFTSVILAKNNSGYAALCSILSDAYAESGEGGKPVIKKEQLKEAGSDLIFLTGGAEGEVYNLLSKGAALEATEVLGEYVRLFGKGNVYLELQYHGREEEIAIIKSQTDLAKTLGIPVVATNECKYLRKEDAGILGLLEAIDKGKTVDDPRELTPSNNQYYFRSPEEMRRLFQNHPEAYDNTLAIADICHVELNPERRTDLPRFPLESGGSSDEVLEREAYAGLVKLYPCVTDGSDEERASKIKGRFEYELDIIKRLGFSDYFLIVSDYVRFAKARGIPVGPGRGSAVGSIVSYALGITEIDPLEYDLYFERFLNPSRRKMPDIDMDFCERRRGEVIDYIRSRFGIDRVAQVATFSTLRARAALQDCARVLKTPNGTVEKLGVVLDRFAKDSGLKFGLIREARMKCEEVKRMMRDGDSGLLALLYAAEKIEDLPRNVSLHAAAVVIAPEPLKKRIPLFGGGGDTRTQCDMYAVERMGLLKMDVLGLRTLTIMEDMRVLCEESGEKIVWSDIPLDDAPTLELIGRGDTIGIFQLESEGMKRVLRRLKPRSFKDVIAVLALYRPGPMQYIDSFVARHNGEEEISYAHPKLAKVLKETYGIMLYQEQVMQALHLILGYTMSNADTFRQIMSKKKVAQMEKEREKFMQAARIKKIDEAVAERLYGDIASFAGYGFNKSHAAAYALIAYRMAYMKAHYPAHFCAALLNAHLGDHEFTARTIREMGSMGFKFASPDVNASSVYNSAVKDEAGTWTMSIGLVGVRGVGEKLAEAVVKERAQGKYTSLDNFCLRIERRLLQPAAVENMIKAGCFDFTNMSRSELTLLANDLLSNWESKNESSLQRSFFSVKQGKGKESEWTLEEKLRYEKEVLGVYVSDHPLNAWSGLFREKATLSSEQLKETAEKEPGRIVVMGGIVNSVRKRFNRKGGIYLVLAMEDLGGQYEVMVWDTLAEEMLKKAKANEVWFLKGCVKPGRDERSPSVWASAFKRFSPDGTLLDQSNA